MTTDRIERILPPLFEELADTRTPDYLEAAIERASSRPQRPRWTYPGRWLPVQITTSATPVARFPWRQIGVLALIGILIAVAAVAVGSIRKPELLPAPPFGLAENGSLALAADGDIVTVDPVTGTTTPIITGSETDSLPTYSPDGTQIAFQRAVADGDRSVIMVAAADGSGLRQVTPEPLHSLHHWTFSPDGTELLVTAMLDERMRLMIQPIDGAAPTVLDVRLPVSADRVEPSTFRPPDGRQFLFMATDVTTMRGLYTFDQDSGETRTIQAPRPGVDLFGASWSPTGEVITFHEYEASGSDEITARLFVAGADGSQVRRADTAADTSFEVQASAFSNDGSRIVLNREYDGGARARSVILDISGDVPTVELACGSEAAPCADSWFWSPDDTQLIGVFEGPTYTYVIADPVTGDISPANWTGSGEPAWQRTGGEAPAD